MAKTYSIHPAIGISRVGDAPVDLNDASSYYLAPEVPGEVSNKGKNYKQGGQIKKQAQRFRIFEYDNNVPVREISLDQKDVAYIKWDVRLANTKAALNTRLPPAQRRNRQTAYTGNRKYLAIDSARPDRDNPDDVVKNVVGAKKNNAPIEDPDAARDLGGFIRFAKYSNNRISDELALPGRAMPLGKIFCDRQSGRLLVFGADGDSGNPTGIPLGIAISHSFANNDGWFDDTSDGIVRAEVGFFSDGSETNEIETVVRVAGDGAEARVICSVPKYAPAFDAIVTLYDVAKDAFFDSNQPIPDPSFWREIYPILLRTSRHQWVSSSAFRPHGGNTPGDFASPNQIGLMMDKNSAAAAARRKMIFDKLRNPEDLTGGNMPYLYGVTPDLLSNPDTDRPYDPRFFTLTKLQYEQMRKWADNEFDVENDQYPAALEDMDIAEQPGALDRAAMDSCLGRAFYPGIECCYRMELRETYFSEFRVKAQKRAGFITQGLSLPWQTDFNACGLLWWPAQRPVSVIRGGTPAQAWTAGIVSNKEMLDAWSKLGFIVEQGKQYIEDERDGNLPIQPALVG